MDIESQKSRYREYIKRLTVGIDIDDRQKLASAYEKLRTANEQFFRNNGKTVGAEQANLLRAALEDVIHEFDTEISVGRALADVDFATGEEGLEAQAAPRLAEPAEPAGDLETEEGSAEVDSRTTGLEAENSSPLAGDRPTPDASRARGTPDGMPLARPNRVAWLLGGAVLGVLATAGVAYALVSTGQIGVLRDKAMIARNATFEKLYAKDISAVEPAVAYLRQVEAAIVERQTTAPGDIAAFGSKFKSIKDFDPGLAKKQPAGLPKGSRVILRADAKGYKVLMQSSLCDAASFVDPGLVDPVRAPDGLGCENFGVWNEAGSKF